ncbi:MAG: ATP-binding cassette domain-containing protein [Planctomycetaceae bacterium]|jgi:phospholipid/cholesterol/gamma-HCH transport system ATP-binding protein|nr:ATP-binding cassette domain-containing protein [Planctomycetaceae bacterium]MBT4011997.1 ATP-binding cassette domain-containing protein [Planctomycetaceae bacterium]MBT4723961.1 ATP-binding cassette domain-containing protein [Planctomycetaceae bacterium]MBT4843804.1 ATP-binding cassette domain-containing protein [Planctomycetaceae bacterium]MBT5124768.1 ATP-binding cassette domain-containing protein [Planctomycetaceae bacterium]
MSSPPPLQSSRSQQRNSPVVSPLLEVRQLCVGFGKRVVLQDITLEVRRGETLAIIGESGCGKTVLLKSLIGLIQGQAGTVHFDGVDLCQTTSVELAQLRTRTGFVFQGAALFDSLTVAENIAFPLRQSNSQITSDTVLGDEDIRSRVIESLREVGLADNVYQRYPMEISGGMRKRVAIARANILKPDLMLYDEPTTGLDPIASDVINELIMQSRLQHTVTSVIVTHDMKTARKVADRVIMFHPIDRLAGDDTQIIFDGPPSVLDRHADLRITQFIHGEAGERVSELSNG